MEDMESKLGAILGNPDMMAQIMAMAQQLGGTSQTAPPPPPSPQTPCLTEGLDLGMITKLAGMASSANIDKDQQALLNALCPYLSPLRIEKLGKAMRAARLANMASGLLSSGILSGR